MARILLANKFYYPRGGDCTATLSLEKLLREKGHDVAIFSTHHPLNNSTNWSNYFPSEIDLSKPKISNLGKAFFRPFFSREVKKKFTKLLDDFKPDIVHVHNIHSYQSPYIVKLATSKGIKVFWTLHDYKLLCPAYTCLRNGSPCELCFHSKHYVLRHKCVKQKMSTSLVAYLEAKLWNRKVLEKYTEKFICPSFFLQDKMAQGGFKKEKTVVLHNFFQSIEPPVVTPKNNYYCYVGRLSPEKGVETLLEAAKQLPYPLKVIGGGDKLAEYQKSFTGSPIEFMGYLAYSELIPIIQRARFTVIPSEWYENNPFSVIESLCMGTPVLGSNMGGIPELVEKNVNGYLFEPGNVEDLKEKIKTCYLRFTDGYNFGKIAVDAQNKFGSESFYNKLMNIYEH